MLMSVLVQWWEGVGGKGRSDQQPQPRTYSCAFPRAHALPVCPLNRLRKSVMAILRTEPAHLAG